MVNLAKTLQKVGENVNEMVKRTPEKVAILEKMANMAKIRQRVAKKQMIWQKGPTKVAILTKTTNVTLLGKTGLNVISVEMHF